MKKLVLIVALALLSASALATPPEFVQDKYRGWFFREMPEEEKAPEAQKPPATAKASEPEHEPFSQEWFAKELPRLKDKAIDEPTEANVLSFMVVQKAWLDTASNFSAKFSEVVMKNPWVSAEGFRPTTAFGTNYYDQRSTQERNRIVKQIASTTGIWFFFRGDCEYCHTLSPLLRTMKDRLGIEILAVSVDGGTLPDFPKSVRDRGQAEKYGINTFPTLMLYRENKLYPLAQGLASQDQILDRMLYFARENNWITPAEWKRTQPVNYDDVLTPAFLKSLPKNVIATPQLLAQAVKAEMVKQSQHQK